MSIDRIAIIGAGLCGLTLSLFLKRDGYSVTIYELRHSDGPSDGAIALSPNGLKTLDAIGLYDTICSNGYQFQKLIFRNNEHEYLDAYEVGNRQKYGYDSFRVYRKDILNNLRMAAEKAGISIIYSRKFSHVVTERDGNVVFAFADGSQQTADLLIGADGIHSIVRRYLCPDVRPIWANMVAISCSAPANAISFPFDSYKMSMPVSIHGPAGAVHIAPQSHNGSEIFVAINWPTHDRSRDGWDEFGADKKTLRDIMMAKDSWNEVVQSAINAASLESFSVWPFYTIPKLDQWCSEQGKVMILGDAAHAIPPTGGQGLNQGLEDVLSFTLVLKAVRDNTFNLKASLRWWQFVRQQRIDGVIRMAREISARRQPGWTVENAKSIDSSWLFNVDMFQTVGDWVESMKVLGKRKKNAGQVDQSIREPHSAGRQE